MYYVRNSNPAIIPQEMFDQAAHLRSSRRVEMSDTDARPFSKKLYCGRCGSLCRSKKTNDVWYWVCRRHEEDNAQCDMPPVPEDAITAAFPRLYYNLKHKTIHILHFTDLQNIRPIYYDKTYHAVPEQGGDKAFELLRRAMKEENKVAVAKTVMGTKEKLLALIPTDDAILVETMFFAEEVKEAPKELGHPQVQEAELTMAKTLINAMVQPFQPEQYHDEYKAKLWEIINKKIQGKEITAPAENIQVNVIDIMEALKQSLAKVKSNG